MAKALKGITIKFGADATALDKALSDVNSQTSKVNTELGKVKKSLQFNPKNTELLAQKQQLLTKQISNTKEKLDKLKSAQVQVQEQFDKGEITEEQYRAFQREIVETESKLNHYEESLKAVNKENSAFSQKLQNASQKLKNVGGKMEDVGKTMSKKVTAPIAGVGIAAAKIGMDFESGMSEVQAISGATGNDLKKLEEKAREMGSTTKFSASDSAEALKYMAMAGWKTEEMVGGLDGVMNLAAASGEDLSTVSDIVTDSMTAFGLKAQESGRFADVLAAASSNSNTNVKMMGETFKYVAPLAGSLGYSVEDTALGIGLMANSGIKGSKAGTALRSTITRLIKPTKESSNAMEKLGIKMTDSKGKMKPLKDVMVDLRAKFKDLDPEQKSFYAAQIAGKEAMSGFLAIINASDKDFDKLQNSINKSNGAAKKMSDIMQDNSKGGFLQLKSAIEELAIKIYDVLKPAIAIIIDKLKVFTDKLNNLSPEAQKMITKIAVAVAAIGPLLVVGGKLSKGLSGFLDLGSKLNPKISDFVGKSGPKLKGFFGKTGTLITGAGSKIGTFFKGTGSKIGAFAVKNGPKIGTFFSGVGSKIGTFAVSAGGKLGTFFSGVGSKIVKLAMTIGIKGAVIGLAIGALIAAGVALYKNWDKIKAKAAELKEKVSAHFNALKEKTSKTWNAMKTAMITPFVNAKNNIQQKAGELKAKILRHWRFIKLKTNYIWNGIKTGMTAPFIKAKENIQQKAGELKAKILRHWRFIKLKTNYIWNGIKNAMTAPVEKAKEKIKEKINSIKGFFSNLKLKKIEIPKFKLPHFKLTGDLSIKKKTVPHLSVDWHAKGAIFTKPYIFGNQGVGEAGPEAVLPISKLAGMMADTLDRMGIVNNYGGDVVVQQMVVRDDNDIKLIANELNRLRSDVKGVNRNLGRAYGGVR